MYRSHFGVRRRAVERWRPGTYHKRVQGDRPGPGQTAVQGRGERISEEADGSGRGRGGR